MCIIALSKSNVRMSEEHITNCLDNNGDGAGFAYFVRNNPIIQKGFFHKRDFLEAYQSIPPDVPVLAHFRIATHGEVSKKNCHPFRVNSANAVFAHNGIFSWPIRGKRMDSEEYIRHVIDKLPANWPSQPGIIAMLQRYFDAEDSRGVFLFPDSVIILNESEGLWDGGIWYSNTSYKSKWPTWTGTTGTRTGIPYSIHTRSYGDRDIPSSDGYSLCEVCGTYLIGLREIDDGICSVCKVLDEASRRLKIREEGN